MEELKAKFQLDPEVVFLNHGSFGATPKSVFEAYQAWQRRLERQPVKFLGREIGEHLTEAKRPLADYLNTSADNLVFVPNATYGVNVVARSLNLKAGDEVLTTNHEYGACDKTWRFLSEKRGFAYIRQPIPLPILPDEVMIDRLWQGVTPRTKVIFISHITSATAVTFPVADICRRAREAGILTLIDGAHAPGQIDLDLTAVDADFYTGNCHKWLCAPKGAAFLYARPTAQSLIEPLVVSWGWGEPKEWTYGTDFLDYLQWSGTHDPSSYLTVPAALTFQAEHEWTTVRQRCHRLLSEAIPKLSELTGLPSPYASDSQYTQMAIIPLPPIADFEQFKERLYDEFCIEIPTILWEDQQFIRISIQGYNTLADLDSLYDGLSHLLPQMTTTH